MKRPSFQFYPGDWLRDSALRSCSVGARGLWIDMLCFMHDCTPYGHLKVGGKVILKDNLARMAGLTLSETEGYLKELSDSGVLSTDAEGCMFCRRMVQDDEIRASRAAGGIKGGNPALINTGKDNLVVNLGDNLPKKEKDNLPLKMKKKTEEVLPEGDSKGGPFSPPSICEVKAWAVKNDLPEIEAEKFWNFYESKGWRVGREKMKSWHGAAGGWKARWRQQGGRPGVLDQTGNLSLPMTDEEILRAAY